MKRENWLLPLASLLEGLFLVLCRFPWFSFNIELTGGWQPSLWMLALLAGAALLAWYGLWQRKRSGFLWALAPAAALAYGFFRWEIERNISSFHLRDSLVAMQPAYLAALAAALALLVVAGAILRTGRGAGKNQ